MLKRITWSGSNGLNSVKGGVGFTYNTDMQVNTETVYPATGGADSVNLKYDKDGLMTRVGALRLRYDTGSNLLLSDTLNGLITNYSYTAFGELASKEATFGATSLFRVDYVRDSLRRITEKRETMQGVTTKDNYAYDAVGRLSSVWKNDTLVSEYSYDVNGNRLAKITPTVVDSGRYDTQDRMLSYGNDSYVYSPYGDQKFKIEGTDTTRYVYDAFGSLVSITLRNGTLIEYLLDGNGLRVGRKVDGVVTQKWLYSNNLRIVAELDGANNVVSRFVYTTSENTPDYMVHAGVNYRLIKDHLGSIRQVVNAQTGDVVQEMEYDEYGNLVRDSNPGFTPFGFAGGLYDVQTEMVRYGVRDYEPSAARWTAKDPVRFQGNQNNLYVYLNNDAVNSTDAKGLALDPKTRAIGTAIIGTALAYMVDEAAQAVGPGRLRGALRMASAFLSWYSAYEALTYSAASFGALTTPGVGTAFKVGSMIVGGAALGFSAYDVAVGADFFLESMREFGYE
jgi:RHS repeat-associated protein